MLVCVAHDFKFLDCDVCPDETVLFTYTFSCLILFVLLFLASSFLQFTHLLFHHILNQIAVKKQKESKRIKRRKKGNHGYDNDLKSMRPLFLAAGPGFKENYSFTETVDMINMYSLFCHLLEIDPSPNNGTLERVGHFLSHPPSFEPESKNSSLSPRCDLSLLLFLLHTIWVSIMVCNRFLL